MNWGTYYGGAGDDHGRAVAVDAGADIVTLAGTTGSPAGIATPGAFDESLDGASDGFAVRFDTAGSRDWGTYLGGEGTDSGRGVTLALDGSVSIVGATDSGAGIATADAHQDMLAGGRDAMVVRLDATGARTWATYYGGPGDEVGTAIDLDLGGELVLTGTTTSATGISSPDALHADPLGGVDVFVVKLGLAGERRWATYYGGAFAESVGPASIAVGGPGSLYLAGTTSSSPGIATMDALFQPEFGGGSDVFLAHLLTYVQGDGCSEDAQCSSGFCVDGVCCDSACGGGDPGDCQACSVANGGTVDGTCSDVADETPCDAGVCQAGACTPDAPTTSDVSTDTDGNSNSNSNSDSDSSSDGDADSNPITLPTTSSDPSSDTPPGGDASTAGDESGEGSGSDTAGQNDDGCGCASSSSPQHLSLAALVLLGLRRRRR